MDASPEGPNSARSRPTLTLAVTAGVLRYCQAMDWAALCEVTFKSGRRADVLALDKKGLFHLFEVKSSKEDFQVDQKWPDYQDYCDTLTFATPPTFPHDLIPQDQGLLIADQYDFHLHRPPTNRPLHPSRKKALTLLFARLAAKRLQGLMLEAQTRSSQ